MDQHLVMIRTDNIVRVNKSAMVCIDLVPDTNQTINVMRLTTMGQKCQTRILYAHWACKTLCWPVELTNPPIPISCKGWSCFGKSVFDHDHATDKEVS